MREFRKYEITKDMWFALSDMWFALPGNNLKKNLRQLSNMISELKDECHTLTYEQQVQAVIRSLPQNWEHVEMHFTHNENIKTLEDAMRHLELKEDRLMASKTSVDAYMASSSSQSGKWCKRK